MTVSPPEGARMVKLMDLPFEMLERIASFVASAESNARKGKRDFLRLRLVSHSFTSAFMPTSLRNIRCLAYAGQRGTAERPLLEQMAIIAKRSQMGHHVRSLSVDCISTHCKETLPVSLSLSVLSAFPRLERFTLLNGGDRTIQVGFGTSPQTSLALLTHFELKCDTIAAHHDVVRQLSAQCPNLQHVSITANGSGLTDMSGTIELQSLSIAWDSCHSGSEMDIFLARSPYRPRHLSLSPCLLCYDDALFESALLDDEEGVGGSADTLLLHGLHESPVLARTTTVCILASGHTILQSALHSVRERLLSRIPGLTEVEVLE